MERYDCCTLSVKGVRGHGGGHPLDVCAEVSVQLALLVRKLDDAAGQTTLDALQAYINQDTVEFGLCHYHSVNDSGLL